jgi:polyisoprenoid-binding protein YceI
MKKTIVAVSLLTASFFTPAYAADYVIDTDKAHAFIDFRIQHLGFSWMSGRFNDFSGNFSYDSNDIENASIQVNIDVASVDTNFAERDKHLRGKFLETDKFPEASFKSTKVERVSDDKFVVTGEFTLHGVTKTIDIPFEKVGEGDDPWGGYRAGFVGTTEFKIADYGIDVAMLGPSAQTVYLTLSIEGIRQ